MTAGIDAAVVRRFGDVLMQTVQQFVMDNYLGEQPVGTAFVVPTNDPLLPYIIHALTMRVPGSIEGTDKVYAATWASLLAVQKHNQAAAHQKSLRSLRWAPDSVASRLEKQHGKWPLRIDTTWSSHIGLIGTL